MTEKSVAKMEASMMGLHAAQTRRAWRAHVTRVEITFPFRRFGGTDESEVELLN